MRAENTITRYGIVSRALHWGMMLLLVWQFSGMVCKILLGKYHFITKALSKNHNQVGTVLFVLICMRIIWSIMSMRKRPAHEAGVAGLAAMVGHLGLYLLMALVPIAALVRAWGGPFPFSPFGFEIFAARSDETLNTAAVEFGSNFHGELGWVLLAMITGHIAMVFYHQFYKKDRLLQRM